MGRALLALVSALFLVGCSGLARVEPGPAPAPTPSFEYRVISHVMGTGDLQSFVGTVPFSAFMKWQGNGTIEARITMTGVVLYLDGDSGFIVTPVPGLEAEADRAVAEGSVVIRRNGQPAGLVRPAHQRPAPAPAAPAPAAAPPAPPPAAPETKPPETKPPEVPPAPPPSEPTPVKPPEPVTGYLNVEKVRLCCDPNDPRCRVPGR